MKEKLYVPLMNSAVNDGNREVLLCQLEKLDIERIFLAVDRSVLFLRGGDRADALLSVKKNIDAFRESGYKVGIWIQAFGFGDPLTGEAARLAADYINLRSVTGKEKRGTDMFCPESEAFASDYMKLVRDLAGCGADLLMLDDDFCLSVRPGLGCFCDAHLRLLEAELGEALSGRDLKKLFFEGGKNRYRDAYLKVMGDTLRRFARRVRQTIDEVDPTIHIGLCAGYTSWDIEGVDALELTTLLAGSTAPFLRFTGAPYWASRAWDRFKGQPLAAIIEEARAQEAFCRGSGVEVFFEADSYPRPRYIIPSSLLECFSLPLHASGGMGELGYFFDYFSSPDYETGYLRHRLYNKPIYDFLDKHFTHKASAGVRVYHKMRKIADSELSENMTEKDIMAAHFNRGAELLGVHGIPTVYEENTCCGIAFGEEARHIDLERLPKKLVIDIAAARILQSRGIDTGLIAAEDAPSPTLETIDGEKILLACSASDGYKRVELKENAEVLGEFHADGMSFPSSYRYISGDTELLVYTFDAGRIPHSAAALLSYARGEQLRGFFGTEAYIEKAPWVYQLRKEGNGEVALLFVNISEDPIIGGEVKLCGGYRHAELCGAEGRLEGDRLCLDSVIPPYGAFAVYLSLNKTLKSC